ncbi:MAG: alpha/beta hydrolase [Vicinamibacteria bacterium]
MTEMPERHPITLKKLVYEIPGMESVPVMRGIEYRRDEAGPLTLDLYRPKNAGGARPPVVVFVTGYRDEGARTKLGCAFKDMESYIGWARLTAMCGMAAVLYENRDPATDAHAVLRSVRDKADDLGVDGARIALWSCSGNGPNALSLLIDAAAETNLCCAVFAYACLLDEAPFTGVADAAKQWGFVTPARGRTIEDIPTNVPLFVARAGADAFPQLNETIDRFAAAAVKRDLPLTLLNLSGAPHAFDVMHNVESSREAIRRILEFLRLHLKGSSGA